MKIPILKTLIHSVSYHKSIDDIRSWSNSFKTHIVYAANVHMVMGAYDSPEFRHIVNSADLVTPDGMPLVWIMRARGVKGQERVYGPHLMLKTLKMAEDEKITVGFIGSTPYTLEKLVTNLKLRYPKLHIGCQISPPYSQATADEDKAIVEQITSSNPRILFVGLGCPKQERWIYEHRDSVNAVMIGVGAAFDFYAGTVSQAPAWIQRMGLEWLFRLVQEPRRLWKRYLVQNPRFAILALLEQFRWMLRGNK